MADLVWKVAAIYEMRAHARICLGDRYEEEVGKAQRIIERRMELDDCSPLSAAIRLAKRPFQKPAPPLVTAVLFAAVVEMAAAEGDW